MSDNKERKVVLTKGVGKYEHIFFKEIQEAILEGWRLAENDLRVDQSMRNFKGNMGRAVFYRDIEGDTKPATPDAPSEPQSEPVLEVKPTPEQVVAEKEKPTTVKQEAPKKRGRKKKVDK